MSKAFIMHSPALKELLRFNALLWCIMYTFRDILQSEISAQPEQWFVFHDFWAGEPPLS